MIWFSVMRLKVNLSDSLDQLSHVRSVYRQACRDVAETWDDARRRRFFEESLPPLEEDLNTAISQLNKLDEWIQYLNRVASDPDAET